MVTKKRGRGREEREEVTRNIRRAHGIPRGKEKVGRKELAERVWEEAVAYDRPRDPNCVILFRRGILNYMEKLRSSLSDEKLSFPSTHTLSTLPFSLPSPFFFGYEFAFTIRRNMWYCVPKDGNL